jgi:hypothetical protein
VPLGAVATLLVTFLLVIAPGDYFVLGWLKLRRYTWLVFTAVSLGFTFWTVHLAGEYMGRVDYREGLVFIDVGAGNRAVRSSRYELQFTATQKTVPTELRSAIYVPLDRRVRSGRDRRFANPNTYIDPEEFEEDAPGSVHEPPVIEGRPPGVYTVHQRMRQWSPRLNRQTTFTPKLEKLPFDFDSVDPAELTTAEGREALREDIEASMAGARVILRNGEQNHLDIAPQYDPATGGQKLPVDYEFVQLAQTLSVRPEQSYFQLVSQISPTGASNFEDLPLFDAGDPKQWLLIVMVTRGPDRLVYRRIYEEGR